MSLLSDHDASAAVWQGKVLQTLSVPERVLTRAVPYHPADLVSFQKVDLGCKTYPNVPMTHVPHLAVIPKHF